MSRYVPIAFGVLLIVGLTIVQVRMTDRLADGDVSAVQAAELLKKIPKEIGDWRGTDLPIADNVRQTAGAIGAVSRKYNNIRTNEEVDLWLIVGHGREISAHTPDICYPSSGFSSRAPENSVHTMVLDDETQVPFLTNTFFREHQLTGRQLYRVFWNWYNTERGDGKVVWEAPTNARWHFGNTRALYKMYFTSVMRDPMETAEQSPATNFAKEFLPVVEKALTQVHDGEESAEVVVEESDPPAETESAESGKAEEAVTEETVTEEEPAAE